MGCTSSAPTVSEVNTNSTEDENKNNVKVENEANVEKNDDAFNHHGDSLISRNGNNTQLKENNSFVSSNSTLKDNVQEKEIEEHVVDINSESGDTSLADGNETSIKDVIEQVIAIKAFEKQASLGDSSTKAENSDEVDEEIKHRNEKNVKNEDNIEEFLKTDKDVLQIHESASPSQSECSRATRWEALADMAAELPPSLTIDPITGQIYSLSK